MRGERNITPESLMGEYGVGRRLATRVAALLSRNVDITGTVLALAGEDEALEKTLLSRELVKAGEWDEGWLQQRADELGFAEADLLRVVPGEDAWRTIALEDDLLAAEMAPDEAREPEDALELARRSPRGMSTQETEELFAPEEVARLKLTALTSQEVDERVEALRKLVFAPMAPAQKASLFMNALVDSEAGRRVRREAIRGLEQIGLREDLAEAVRGLFGEEADAAVYAVQRLGALLRESDHGETSLVLAVVLEVLSGAEDSPTVRALLKFITENAPILVGNEEKTAQFVRAALRHLERAFDALRMDVEAALRACCRAAPGLMADLMWKELRRSDSPPVRAVLVSLTASLDQSPEQRADLADRAVREILNPRLPEAQRARLRYGLVRLGAPAARAALRRMPEAETGDRVELARLLDVLCTEADVPADVVQDAVRAMLDLLKLADVGSRRSVLRAGLLADERAGAELQAEVAAELLNLMSELGLVDTYDAIQATLGRIGLPALGPCCWHMRRDWPDESARRAAQAAADIIEEHGREVEDDLAADVLEWARQFVGDERQSCGEFAYPLGAVCGYTPVGADAFEQVLENLLADLWRMPYCMDALEALAVMAGAPNADVENQERLFDLFDTILAAQARVGGGKRRETDEGPIYEFGREIEFDIRAVPAAVRGFQQIYLSRQADQELRARIVRQMLVLWEGVSKVRIVWGPAGIQALVDAMCAAACSEHADTATRVRLGTSLLRFLNKLSVVRSIGRICSRPTDAEPMQQLAREAADELLKEWHEADQQDEERRLALLLAMGRIASGGGLPPGDQAATVRERVMQALFAGLREGMRRVREPLLALRRAEGVSSAQRQEIDDRLAKVFGLVKT